MKYQNSIFRQLLEFIPRDKFQDIVDKHEGDKKTRKLSCWTQFIALSYSQIRAMDSIRTIENGLNVQRNHWYHLDISGIKRSTFSDANNKRPCRIYEDLFEYLLGKCQHYSRSHFAFNNPIRSMDATTIELCQGLFPWAKFGQSKGGIKVHVQLEHNSYLPDMVVITDQKDHEVKVFQGLKFKPDSIYVVDRGYLDFEVLHRIHTSRAYFVIRAKKDMNYSVVGQQKSDHPQVIADEEIQVPWLHRIQSSKRPKYPDILRLVTYEDPETGKIYRFLTNIENFRPETIALIYKQRWQIELFFKWIKQHLKIKAFIGNSRNAVMTQIWIAMIVYLIFWYFKHQTKFKGTLFHLASIINEILFSRVHLLDILGFDNPDPPSLKDSGQLLLWCT